MLENDFKFFKDNHQRLFDEYPNKYLVIKEKTVIATADNFEDALSQAKMQGLELGTFLIQYCSEGESSYTQSFHSRVTFA